VESPPGSLPFLSRRHSFGEQLIDLEVDKAARAVEFGLLRVMERK
jgi:hypothetical protein